MLKDEKKILNSPALDTPDKSVLQDAKAYMPKKKGVNTRLARILAPIACVIVVAVVLGMIPAMIPANSGDPNHVTAEMMTVESIDSIATYNSENGTALLHFDNATSSTAYSYLNKVMVIEEFSAVQGYEVALLVVIKDNAGYYRFDVDGRYDLGLVNEVPTTLCGKTVYLGNYDGKVYVRFIDGGNEYKIEIKPSVDESDNTIDEGVAENILSELFD